MTAPTCDTPERLVRDFGAPMLVEMPDGTRYLRARVFVTDRRLLVFSEAVPPVREVDAELVGTDLAPVRHPSATVPHRVSTRDGEIRIRRALGACSCRLPNLMALRWPL